jgi:hypothetical protein
MDNQTIAEFIAPWQTQNTSATSTWSKSSGKSAALRKKFSIKSALLTKPNWPKQAETKRKPAAHLRQK